MDGTYLIAVLRGSMSQNDCGVLVKNGFQYDSIVINPIEVVINW